MKKLILMFVMLVSAIIISAQDAAEKINAANEALKAQEYAKAFQLYDEAMNNLGDVQIDKAINFNIGLAAAKSGNMEGAEKYYAKAIEAGVHVSKCHEDLGNGYLEKKDYAKALGCYEKAIAASDNKENTNNLIFKAATVAYNNSFLDKATELFNKSIEFGYKAETAIYFKAVILNKQGKTAEYKAALEEAIQKYPGDSKIGPALAKIYFSEGYEIYKNGAGIITAANQKVTGGKLKTTDEAYLKEVEKAKTEYKNARAILEKSKALDASNPNVQKLIDGCNQLK